LDPHRLIEIASLIMPFSAFPNDTKSHAPYQNRLNRDPFVYRISEEKSPDLELRTKKAKFVEAAANVEQADAEHPEDKMYIDYLQNNRNLDTSHYLIRACISIILFIQSLTSLTLMIRMAQLH
jgi:hypothetical protein